MFKSIKRIFKRLQKDREWQKRRRLSDHRAANLAIKLTLTGSLGRGNWAATPLVRTWK